MTRAGKYRFKKNDYRDVYRGEKRSHGEIRETTNYYFVLRLTLFTGNVSCTIMSKRNYSRVPVVINPEKNYYSLRLPVKVLRVYPTYVR